MMKMASTATSTAAASGANSEYLVSSSVVRVKLSLYKVDSGEVSNVWMSLDYSQRPTVWHVCEYIRSMYLNDYCDTKDQQPPVINLYMDEYWIPPYEKSRLLRENDSITVEICPAEYQNESLLSLKKTASTTSVSAKKASEKKNLPASASSYADYYFNNNSCDISACSNAQPAVETYWDALKRTSAESVKALVPDIYSSLPVGNDKKQKKSSPPVSLGKSTSTSESMAKSQKSAKPTKSSGAGSSSSVFGCHKKFSIGSYAHLLSEPVVPPTESDTVSSKNNNKTKPSSNKPMHESELDSNAVDKMAASLAAQGKAKWKNSSKPAATEQPTQPKHIRFDSSSEDDSSSSSSSSSSSESEEEIETKPTKIEKPEVKSVTSSATKQPSKYYEPSKEDQLNVVSNNRSFLVQNTKDLNEFKKTFNQAKLNAPKTEAESLSQASKQMTESGSMSSLNGSNVSSSETKSPRNRRRNKNKNQNESTAASNNNTNNNRNSSPNATKPSSKQRNNKRQPAAAATDYSKCESLNGTPRQNDKIAFQILELSKNFTPEISDYKTGTVKDYDSTSNQVTIKLDSQLKSVLERSSKFSVVDDENDENAEDNYKENENMSCEEGDLNEIQVDLNNLINIKLLK